MQAKQQRYGRGGKTNCSAIGLPLTRSVAFRATWLQHAVAQFQHASHRVISCWQLMCCSACECHAGKEWLRARLAPDIVILPPSQRMIQRLITDSSRSRIKARSKRLARELCVLAIVLLANLDPANPDRQFNLRRVRSWCPAGADFAIPKHLTNY